MSEDRWDATLEQLTLSAALSVSDALSLMLNDGIEVLDCRIFYASARDALLDRLRSRRDWLAVSQTAVGTEPVKVSLIVGKAQVDCLLDRLMGRPGGLRRGGDGKTAALGNTEIDALRETANIVTGSCAAVLGRELGITSMSMPSFASQDLLDDIVSFLMPDQDSVCAESRLKAATHSLELDLFMAIGRKNAIASVAHTNGQSSSAPRDA